MNKFTKISLRVILWLLGVVIGLIILLYILINIPKVQNFVVQKVVSYIETKIETPVRLERVSLKLPKLLVLEGVYFEDQKQDTLLAGESLAVDISLLKLLNNKVEINELNFKGITANIDRTLPDSAFNFDYIIRAFVSEEVEEESTDTAAAMDFSIDKINLDRIRLRYNDEVIGTNADFYLGHLDTRIKNFDLENMHFEIPKVSIEGIKTIVHQAEIAEASSVPATDDLGVEAAAGEDAAFPDVKLGEVSLKDIDVVYTDAATAMDAKLKFKNLLVDFNELDLRNEKVDIKKLLLEDTDAALAMGRATTATEGPNETDTSSTEEPINWIVNIDDMDVSNTHVAYDDNTAPRLQKGLDYAHMNISDLNIDLDELYFSMDSISGNLQSFTFRDTSGLQLNKLETQFAYTNQGVLLEDFILETPNTQLASEVTLSYPSLDAISENPELIDLSLLVDDSRLGMADVVLLVPTLDTMEVMQPLLTRSFDIDADLNGSLADLRIRRFVASTLDDTYVNISGSVRNVMEPERLFADLKINNLQSSNRDLTRLIAKTLLPPDIEIPNSIKLTGVFRGGMNSFRTNLDLNTSVGNADLLANYNAARDTSYSAKVNIQNLDVGGFLKNDTTFGAITFVADVEGVGLDPRTMVAKGEATLVDAEVMGYPYHDIKLNFQADKGNILANLLSSDPNIAVNMNAQATWTDKYPQLLMNLNVDSLNLKNLNLVADDIRYHGRLEADLPTADPDYLNGDINVVNSLLLYNGERYALDSIKLHSEATDSLKFLNLEAEFMNAMVYGDYKLTQIGTAIQDVIETYYNPTNVIDTTSYDPQTFEFNAEIIRSPLIRRVAPALAEMEPITLFGNFASETKSLNARIGAPHVLYDSTLIDDVSFDINTADSTLYYAGVIGEVNVSNINLVNTLISGNVNNSIVNTGLWIRDTANVNQYHIGAELLAENNDFIFRLKPDGLILNYDQWNIQEANAIRFGDLGIHASNFILENNGQSFQLQSRDSSRNSPIDALFSNFRIETFTKFIESETLKLGGAINGDATIDRFESSPVFVSDLTINDFYFGVDTIGDINIQVNNQQENTFAANITVTGNGNDLNLSGDYISPPEAPSTMDFDLNINRLNISTLEAFSFGSLRRADGYLNGQLAITGSPDAPRLNGSLLFNEAELNVSMLNAQFYFDNDAIQFNDQGIRFQDFSIADSVGNTATINGLVSTSTYTDFDFNLAVEASDFQVLNSSKVDNELFYGTLFLDSDLRITGTMESPQVNGTLNVNDRTKMTFVVPDSEPGLTEREGIIKFVDRSDSSSYDLFEQQLATTPQTVTGMDVSVNIGVDPDAEFNVIIDPGTGDALFIKGEAQLNAGISPGGNMSLAGTYEVEEGYYNLSFNMIKRRFDFKQGSTIVWNGEPMAADLNITAAYDIDAAPIDLLENQLAGRNSNYYKQKIPFEVELFITGEMMKPEISFGIDLQEENAGVSQDVTSLVETRLSQIRENESELNKQVFALILLGRFVAENPFSSAAGGSVESMARNSVSDLLSAQLNNLAGDLISGVELNFDLQSTDDYSTGTQQNRTDLNVGVSKRLLNDRLKVTVGSNFEIEGGQPGRQPTNIAGDIAIEYQLSKDGRYFLRAFRKNQYEVTLQGQVIETGLGFNINMDYDKFLELFMGAERLQQYLQEVQERKNKALMQSAPVQRKRQNPSDSTQVIKFREEGAENEE